MMLPPSLSLESASINVMKGAGIDRFLTITIKGGGTLVWSSVVTQVTDKTLLGGCCRDVISNAPWVRLVLTVSKNNAMLFARRGPK